MGERNYWITMNKTTWIIVLVASFFIFFPAFVIFLIFWAINRVKIIE
jgi:hypothetical protein